MVFIIQRWKKQYILPVVTVGVFMAIGCIVGFGKASVPIERRVNPIIMIHSNLIDNKELNEPEQALLTQLHNWIDPIAQRQESSQLCEIYGICLEEYLNRKGIDLNATNAAEVIHKIQKLEQVMKLEAVDDFKKMTLDGRATALQLSQEIYELCGLTLTYNIMGDIEQITDQEGTLLYHREKISQQAEIQVGALIITLVFITLFLLLCIIYAKKKHLFVMDDYDYYKELEQEQEEYA